MESNTNIEQQSVNPQNEPYSYQKNIDNKPSINPLQPAEIDNVPNEQPQTDLKQIDFVSKI